jgi:hypothetical protein
VYPEVLYRRALRVATIRDALAYYKMKFTEMIWPAGFGLAALRAIFTGNNGCWIRAGLRSTEGDIRVVATTATVDALLAGNRPYGLMDPWRPAGDDRQSAPRATQPALTNFDRAVPEADREAVREIVKERSRIGRVPAGAGNACLIKLGGDGGPLVLDCARACGQGTDTVILPPARPDSITRCASTISSKPNTRAGLAW